MLSNVFRAETYAYTLILFSLHTFKIHFFFIKLHQGFFSDNLILLSIHYRTKSNQLAVDIIIKQTFNLQQSNHFR